MTILKQLQTSEPVAFGGFSELHVLNGQAVKLLEDACYADVLEECYIQNLAADAGLAPRVHAVAELANEVVVVMDVIDTDEYFQADDGGDVIPVLLGDLPSDEQGAGLHLYCKLLNAGVLHADFHTGNWFMNDKCDVLAIDFGIASELSRAPERHIKRAVQFMLPALQQQGWDVLASNLYEAWLAGPEVAREELAQVAASIV